MRKYFEIAPQTASREAILDIQFSKDLTRVFDESRRLAKTAILSSPGFKPTGIVDPEYLLLALLLYCPVIMQQTLSAFGIDASTLSKRLMSELSSYEAMMQNSAKEALKVLKTTKTIEEVTPQTKSLRDWFSSSAIVAISEAKDQARINNSSFVSADDLLTGLPQFSRTLI